MLQAQNLLTQLPQSQANLLPTQPSITLATQVGHDASTSFKLQKCSFYHFIFLSISSLLTLPNLNNNRILYFAGFCSLQLQPAQQQPHLFSPCPTVRPHLSGWIPPLWRSLVIWRNWNSLPRPSNRGVSNWALHRCVCARERKRLNRLDFKVHVYLFICLFVKMDSRVSAAG